jgi:hypothetical protein
MEALHKGYDVEIDLWYIDGVLSLGHDGPEYPTDHAFLSQIGLWIHCKNIMALSFMADDDYFNVFYHANDDVTLTSFGYLWTYPGKLVFGNSIAVMPEMVKGWNIKGAYGVCTDFPLKYKI